MSAANNQAAAIVYALIRWAEHEQSEALKVLMNRAGRPSQGVQLSAAIESVNAWHSAIEVLKIVPFDVIEKVLDGTTRGSHE